MKVRRHGVLVESVSMDVRVTPQERAQFRAMTERLGISGGELVRRMLIWSDAHNGTKYPKPAAWEKHDAKFDDGRQR